MNGVYLQLEPHLPCAIGEEVQPQNTQGVFQSLGETQVNLPFSRQDYVINRVWGKVSVNKNRGPEEGGNHPGCCSPQPALLISG